MKEMREQVEAYARLHVGRAGSVSKPARYFTEALDPCPYRQGMTQEGLHAAEGKAATGTSAYEETDYEIARLRANSLKSSGTRADTAQAERWFATDEGSSAKQRP